MASHISILSLILLVISAQHHGGRPNKDTECFNELSELNKSFEEINSTINNRDDMSQLQDRLSKFILVLPNTLIKCIGTLNYDMSKPVEGTDPDLSKVHDCKSAYIELINQIRRIAKAYNESNIENISKSSSKLEPIREKILEHCSEYNP